MKLCTLCNKVEIEKGSWCRECTKNYNRLYRQSHKKKLAKMNHRWRKKHSNEYKNMKYAYYTSKPGRVVELYRAAKRRAKEKGISFSLTTNLIEQMWNEQNNKCALTGIDFQIPQERTGGKARPFAPSIDRIDCSKGYTRDNVRLVCVAVNYALNEFGEVVFRQIAQAYLNQISTEKEEVLVHHELCAR